MQRIIRYFIILLLVAAIGSFSMAIAGTEFCSPECSDCGVADVVSPCCDDMNSDKAVTPESGRGSHSHGCGHSSYCDAIERGNSAISVNTGVDIDCPLVVHGTVFSLPELSARQYTLSLKSPPQWRIPYLYTLHCSLLI